MYNSKRSEELKEKLEKDTSNFEKEAKSIIENAKYEAKQILLSAKEDANTLIRELENTSSSSKANKIRATLNEKIANKTSDSLDIYEPINIEKLKVRSKCCGKPYKPNRYSAGIA